MLREGLEATIGLAVIVSALASMTLVILLSIRGYRRMEGRYSRLLARYTRLQEHGKHAIAPEEWVNAAGERYVHRGEVIGELRALHTEDTEDPA